jgi:hypothetical protein
MWAGVNEAPKSCHTVWNSADWASHQSWVAWVSKWTLLVLFVLTRLRLTEPLEYLFFRDSDFLQQFDVLARFLG